LSFIGSSPPAVNDPCTIQWKRGEEEREEMRGILKMEIARVLVENGTGWGFVSIWL